MTGIGAICEYNGLNASSTLQFKTIYATTIMQ